MHAFPRGYRRWRLLAVLLVGSLAGCSGASWPTLSAPDTSAPSSATPKIATVPPKLPKTTKQHPAATATSVDPERLLGMNAAGLRDNLGPPSAVTADGPAEIWEYAMGECLLRLYLYADIGTGERRTLRYNASRAPGAGADTDCKPPLSRSAGDGSG